MCGISLLFVLTQQSHEPQTGCQTTEKYTVGDWRLCGCYSVWDFNTGFHHARRFGYQCQEDTSPHRCWVGRFPKHNKSCGERYAAPFYTEPEFGVYLIKAIALL